LGIYREKIRLDIGEIKDAESEIIENSRHRFRNVCLLDRVA
jgi:hypothetical protein